jgi:hypothetical protein
MKIWLGLYSLVLLYGQVNVGMGAEEEKSAAIRVESLMNREYTRLATTGLWDNDLFDKMKEQILDIVRKQDERIKYLDVAAHAHELD